MMNRLLEGNYMTNCLTNCLDAMPLEETNLCVYHTQQLQKRCKKPKHQSCE